MSSGDLALYQQLDSQLTSLADEFSNLVRASAGMRAAGKAGSRFSGRGRAPHRHLTHAQAQADDRVMTATCLFASSAP